MTQTLDTSLDLDIQGQIEQWHAHDKKTSTFINI